MSYRAHQKQMLQRLKVKQLPTLCEPNQHEHDAYHNQKRRSSESSESSEAGDSYEVNDAPNPFAMHLPIRDRPVPGRRCPNCLARGQTFWVVPGKRCSQCGTEVN